MNPAVVVPVGAWFIVWASSGAWPTSTIWTCLGSFQDEAQANSLRDTFNDPANHVDSAIAPGVALLR